MSAAEIEIKVQEEGLSYIPKRLREHYGNRIIILPNETSGLIYKPDAKPSEIIRSVKILIQHLEVRAEKEEDTK